MPQLPDISMTKAERFIIERILSLEMQIIDLKSEKALASLEEVSLNKASKILRLGSDTLVSMIKRGLLPARKYRDSKHKIRYRLLLTDIKEFQDRNKTNHIEFEISPANELADEIFINRKNNFHSENNNL